MLLSPATTSIPGNTITLFISTPGSAKVAAERNSLGPKNGLPSLDHSLATCLLRTSFGEHSCETQYICSFVHPSRSTHKSLFPCSLSQIFISFYFEVPDYPVKWFATAMNYKIITYLIRFLYKQSEWPGSVLKALLSGISFLCHKASGIFPRLKSFCCWLWGGSYISWRIL